MKTRLITALILVAIFLPLFLISGWAMYLMVAIVTGMAMYELTCIHAKKWSMTIRWLIIIIYSLISFVSIEIFPWCLLIMSFFLCQLSVWNKSFSLDDGLLYSTFGLFISLAGYSVLKYGLMGGEYMIYIAVVTFTTDTMAYFGGRYFGKHKLNERISPKKTWEGAITGFIFGVMASLVMSYFFAEVTFGLIGSLVLGIVLAIGGQLGDLMFSLIKRHYNVKDFSSLLPGHGGMLDRIDSLIINICAYAVIMQILGYLL